MTELAERMRAAAGGRKVFIVAENERSNRASRARSRKGGYGLDGLWNDDFHHSRPGRRDRPQRGLLHRLSRQAAGIDFGGEVRIPVPGPALQVAVEAPRRTHVGPASRRSSSTTSRITIRSPIRAAASGWRKSQVPGACKPSPPSCCSRPARRCCFRGRNSLRPSPFSSSPITMTSCAETGARGPPPVSLAVSQPRAARDAPLPPRPRRSCNLRALQAGFLASAKRTRPSIGCTRICCACAAKIPYSAHRATRGWRGARRARLRAALLRRRRPATGFCWSTWAAILLLDIAPEPCSRRPKNDCGRRTGPAKTRIRRLRRAPARWAG